MLKPEEFEIWIMRIEQYIQMIDYSLWEVIENEDKAQRRLEGKARRTLMLGIPNEYQLNFNSIKDAKSLLEAIEKRLQKLVSQLKLLKESISQEDVNQKFLRSLPSEWNMHAVVNAANSTNIDKLSDAIIIAFLASQSNSSQLEGRSILMGMRLFPLTKPRWNVIIVIRGGHFAKEYRAPRAQENRNKESTRRNVHVKTTNSSALVSCDGLEGYDSSDQNKEGPNYVLMANSTPSSDSEAGLKLVEERLEFLKTNESIYSEDIKKLKFEIHCNEITIRELRKKLETVQKEKDGIQLTIEKLENASKNLNKLIDSQILDNCKKGLGYTTVPPPHTVKTLNAKTSEEVSKKMKDDKESAELKQCLEIIPDDGDNVTIDATPLSSKSPIIVDYNIYKEVKKNYFQIFRAYGNSQMYLTSSKLLNNFNREDLEVLWRLVKDKFIKTKPVDYMDSFLLHTLKTMFEHHVEDNVWKNQQGLAKVVAVRSSYLLLLVVDIYSL
uniref:Uncharacterized protein n=1 Tax=Tanacetum cinerariifolium TaxID=118510 RepID=A0A6L2LHP5_TANCI|nr:hypothetical protein [Tanacetum cinerariifolium]